MQVQSRLLEEPAFRDTVAVLQAGQARLRTHMRVRTASRLQQGMERCLALSRARAARAQRVERLKRNLEKSRSGFEGADPQRMPALTSTSPSRGSAAELSDLQLLPAQRQSSAAQHFRADSAGGGAQQGGDGGADGAHGTSGEAEQTAGAHCNVLTQKSMPSRQQAAHTNFVALHSMCAASPNTEGRISSIHGPFEHATSCTQAQAFRQPQQRLPRSLTQQAHR